MERSKYERVDYSLAKKFYKTRKKETDKKDLYEEVSSRYVNNSKSYDYKLRKFDEVFDLADNLAFQRRERPTQIKKLRDELVLEYYKYKNSFLSKYMTKSFKEKFGSHSIQRQFSEARKLVILDRFKNFRSAYGSEKIFVNINGEEKEISIRTLFTMYKQGKISKEVLYDRIDYFHNTVLIKYNTKEYRQRDGNVEFSRYASK